MNNNHQHLLFGAFQIASRAAAEYLRSHNQQAVSDDALAERVKSWVKAKLPEALQDAREALECHMGSVAEQTFGASMALAGIEAAKECGRVEAMEEPSS